MERIEEANIIIEKEYKHHDNELESLEEKRKCFNKELDGIISMLNGVEKIESSIQHTEQNVKQILLLLNKICK